jgi:hypothetical protein
VETDRLKESISEIQQTIDAWKGNTDFETRWILSLLEWKIDQAERKLRALEQSPDDSSGP